MEGKKKGNKNVSKKNYNKTARRKEMMDRQNDRFKKRKNVWKQKEVGRERRKHMSKTVRILKNGRKIINQNKEDIDQTNFTKILNCKTT